MLTFESSIVWLKKKMEILWKNMQRLPKSRRAFLSNMRQVTIQNNFLYIVQNYRFHFKVLIEILFYLFIYSIQKNKTN